MAVPDVAILIVMVIAATATAAVGIVRGGGRRSSGNSGLMMAGELALHAVTHDDVRLN